MPAYTISAKITGDSSSFNKAVDEATKGVEGMAKKTQQAGRTLEDAAKAQGKTVDEMRAEVGKAAAAYQKAGMTASEAWKQAYADIGYSAGAAGTACDEAERSVSKLAGAMQALGAKVSAAGSGISKIGAGLTSHITKPALAAGGALAGLTLAKGFSRLTGIDNARAKLTGLGHDAESVTEIMDSAMTSVKGTAFGMDEAATTAAGAVAAGIEPGQELTRYLTLTADAAAIAGVSMSEMGSIINKVQTGQTAYTENLEQLADRGLPIYQWIADEAGVAASEVKKMASDGEISSEMFLAAIEKNIGGAAKTMGEGSFTATIANIGASISRIGANFLDAGGQGGGFFSTLKPLLADFNSSLAVLEEKASELGVKFGNAFQQVVQKVQDLKARFDALSPSMQGMVLKTAGIGAAVATGIGPAMQVVGRLTTAFGSFGGMLGGLLPKLSALGVGFNLPTLAIGGLIALFVAAFARSEEFRNALGGLLQTVASLGMSLLSALVPAVQAILPVFLQLADVVGALMAQLLPIITNIVGQLAPVLTEIITIASQLVAEIMPLVSMLISQLAPVLSMLIGFISSLVGTLMPPLLAVIQAIMAVVQALMPVIRAIVSVVSSVLQAVIAALAPFIQFVAGTIETIMAIIAPIVTFIANILQKVLSVIGPVIETVSGLISALVGVVSRVFQAIYQTISSVMGSVGGVFKNIFSAIQDAWNGLTSFVGGVFDGIRGAVESLVNTVKGFVNGVISGINAAIGLINMIPGVNIGTIPYLAHGTKNWQGGAARMNEGGRGEIVVLPSGTQVIPHDVSMKYAREAGRKSAGRAAGQAGDYREGDIYVTMERVEIAGDYDVDELSHQLAIKTQRERRALNRAMA